MVARLRAAGHQALFAGGCVRDGLLGRPVREIDIATSAPPDAVIGLFPRTVPVGRAFGVVLVLEGSHRFEVATFRSDGPYLDGRHPSSVTYAGAREDALRRDFTINGMFLDPATGEVIDHVGGKADLQARLVRAIGEPRERYAEDKLRLLRAVRFSAQLGFALEDRTAAALRELAPAIREVSAERIRDELFKILVHPSRSAALQGLKDSGLLRAILPEVDAMSGVEQPPEYHPEGDVWTHTKLCLDSLVDPGPELALAVLLHDVAKPVTQTRTDRIRFNGHDRVGADMARDIASRLKLSAEQRDRITWLVARHLAFLQVDQMKRSTLKRIFAAPHIEDLFAVIRADTIGSKADPAFVDRLAALRASMPPDEIRPEPLVTGADLIRLGYRPGPAFKKTLSDLLDAQLEGTLATKADALEKARALLGDP